MAMNDAHIYCRKDQIKEEFLKVLRLHERMYGIFGITDYYMRFSRWDPKRKEKYIDQPENWEMAEAGIKEALDESGLKYVEAMDEAAFYGPKIDFQIRSIIGTEYTISTSQLDFAGGDRFNLRYIGEDSKEHKVFVIHRAPLGTHERFIAFLIEHYAGHFPTWLAPVQVKVLMLSDKSEAFANTVTETLRNEFVRVVLDDRSESLGKKIRQAEGEKVPYMLVIGEKEAEAKSVAVRKGGGKSAKGGSASGGKDVVVKLEEFVKELVEEIKTRA
jgi:threonyl-tRNA synthetase